jgi:hypothetical protein
MGITHRHPGLPPLQTLCNSAPSNHLGEGDEVHENCRQKCDCAGLVLQCPHILNINNNNCIMYLQIYINYY